MAKTRGACGTNDNSGGISEVAARIPAKLQPLTQWQQFLEGPTHAFPAVGRAAFIWDRDRNQIFGTIVRVNHPYVTLQIEHREVTLRKEHVHEC